MSYIPIHRQRYRGRQVYERNDLSKERRSALVDAFSTIDWVSYDPDYTKKRAKAREEIGKAIKSGELALKLPYAHATGIIDVLAL